MRERPTLGLSSVSFSAILSPLPGCVNSNCAECRKLRPNEIAAPSSVARPRLARISRGAP
jgi:hypothetical protein